MFITGGTGSIGSHLLKQFRATELKFGALPYREGEIMESAADIGALERLGWRPSFSLEQGLAHAIEAEDDPVSDARTTA
jgi:nucleoside-diphosphate-sugar epimerase